MVHAVPLSLAQTLTFASFLCVAHAASNPNPFRVDVLGPQGINLWRLDKARGASAKIAKELSFVVQENEAGLNRANANANAISDFEARWFEQPLDHFAKESNQTFLQRYWVNDRHYVPGSGAPVIVLDGGETSGEDRLTFLDTGIVEILTKATGGVGVVLEHRYYGDSMPVNNLTTDSLRWLDNEQSAADSANFMASIKFDGIDEDLTAPNTPWIYYGGSYAGARAAHMKVLYPELTYGAIASSAVTHAALSNWEYMEVIRLAADPKCSSHLENSIAVIDHVLDQPHFRGLLKGLFGLKGLEHDEDFVSLLSSPLGSWQSRVWSPFGSNDFDEFCAALSKPFGRFSAAAADLPFGDPARMVSLSDDLKVDFTIFNYAQYIKEHYVAKCPADQTVEDCFGTYDDAKFQLTTLDQDWRLWTFQVCTQWGYFTTAPPDQDHPRIISRRLTLEYESKICKQAYPPGQHFTVPALPNITAVNALGDFDLAADRLAFIDGEVDPWRPDTPHSQFYAKDRADTILRPFKIIPGGVHHWDEWGLLDLHQEPADIQKIHAEMIGFVEAWLEDFKAPTAGKED
ncbi:hypothetical protein H0H92_016015 [Tricholoma furcatifolium]|nr:hypothetical protein H0H92_016015 [Tricholoma furcatifolium]